MGIGEGMSPSPMRKVFDFRAQNGEISCIVDAIFSVRCNTYTLCLCYDVSVRLSVYLPVTEVNLHIIANLRFKFRSKFTLHCRRGEGSSQQQHLALCLPLLGPFVTIWLPVLHANRWHNGTILRALQS